MVNSNGKSTNTPESFTIYHSLLTIYRKWWPGTESNRRRRPFQGRLPYRRSGLKSTGSHSGLRTYDVSELGWFRMIWAVLGPTMYVYCTSPCRVGFYYRLPSIVLSADHISPRNVSILAPTF